MSEHTDSFGYWLRRRRKALDMTQEALAESVSCSPSAIRKIETDERRPSKRLAERLADRLSIPPDEHAAFLDSARGIHTTAHLDVDREPRWSSSDRPSVVTVPASSVPLSNAHPLDESGTGQFVGRRKEMDALKSALSDIKPDAADS